MIYCIREVGCFLSIPACCAIKFSFNSASVIPPSRVIVCFRVWWVRRVTLTTIIPWSSRGTVIFLMMLPWVLLVLLLRVVAGSTTTLVLILIGFFHFSTRISITFRWIAKIIRGQFITIITSSWSSWSTQAPRVSTITTSHSLSGISSSGVVTVPGTLIIPEELISLSCLLGCDLDGLSYPQLDDSHLSCCYQTYLSHSGSQGTLGSQHSYLGQVFGNSHLHTILVHKCDKECLGWPTNHGGDLSSWGDVQCHFKLDSLLGVKLNLPQWHMLPPQAEQSLLKDTPSVLHNI